MFFGVDKKVLDVVGADLPEATDARRGRAAEVFQLLAHRADVYRGRREENASSGLDGTLLVDRRGAASVAAIRRHDPELCPASDGGLVDFGVAAIGKAKAH